ncbi:MAG: ABC transporter substrate-binding protein [Ignavibacteria bacterium]|nr:ABC transporter substrate-binding protein [Ignavibacteria bacterium]
MTRSLFVFLFILLLCQSCTKKEGSERFFRYNEPNGIESLDPVTANNYPALHVLINVCEGLVEYDKDARLVPLIAKSYSISEDGTLYTFNLKNDVFFHDNECFPGGKGRRVTAYDFKYCYERVCDPRSKTRGLWVYRDKVVGAEEFASDPDNVKEVKGFIAVNDSVFQIKLKQPFAPFLSILTMPYGYVYPKEAVEHYKENFGFHIVGTGPFRFKKWEMDKELICVRNDKYHKKDSDGRQLPYIDGFKVYFIRSSETEFLDFTSGKLDFMKPSIDVYSQITDEKGVLKQEYNFDLIKQPYLNTVYLCAMLNPEMEGGKNNPLSQNTKLRKALNYAIDREKIVNYVLRGKGSPGIHGPLPKGMPGFSEDVKGYDYDPEKAKQLLSEAGYPDGRGLKLKIIYHNDESQRELCEALQSQFKEIGINLEIEEMVGAAHRSAQNEGKLPFWRANWGADYYDPENYYALFYSKNATPIGPNTSHYKNPAVDSLYELGLKLTGFEERMKVYREIDKYIFEDSPWMIVYYNQYIYLRQKNVKGMYVDGLGIINLRFCSFD